jgi:hypothetical protein
MFSIGEDTKEYGKSPALVKSRIAGYLADV